MSVGKKSASVCMGEVRRKLSCAMNNSTLISFILVVELHAVHIND